MNTFRSQVLIPRRLWIFILVLFFMIVVCWFVFQKPIQLVPSHLPEFCGVSIWQKNSSGIWEIESGYAWVRCPGVALRGGISHRGFPFKQYSHIIHWKDGRTLEIVTRNSGIRVNGKEIAKSPGMFFTILDDGSLRSIAGPLPSQNPQLSLKQFSLSQYWRDQQLSLIRNCPDRSE